jgi:P27 family predicted phage terminase small subunit
MKKAPSTLTQEAAEWWDKILTEYQIDDEAGFLILQTALESFDRMREAQGLIKRDGLVFETESGGFKPHPAAIIERNSRAAMLSALKALNLDIEPLNDRPGRPGGY